MNRVGILASVLVGVFLAALVMSAAQEQEYPYDAYRAEKNLEIGLYYLKKSNYDAAIERFRESIRFKPNYARPHRLIAEAYEKKGDRVEAIKYYERYLEILPSADDAEKVRKRIQKLAQALEREARRKRRSD